jgi:hypothetical protein
MLEIALAYRARGWGAVPQLPLAKQPCVRWKPFQACLPTPLEIGGWYEQWPDAGVALVLGQISDLFVIDVDGEAAYRVLLARLGSIPATPRVLSGSGDPYRTHLFFRHPLDITTMARFTPWHAGLEFRGDRGIVIAPPSLHKSGNRYRWAPGCSPDDLPLATVPGQIVDELRRKATQRVHVVIPEQVAAAPVNRQPRTSNVDIGSWLDGLRRRGLSQATVSFLACAHADAGSWNSRLFAAACDLAGCDFGHEEAARLLLAGARPRSGVDAEAARRAIESAYSQERAPAKVLARGANPDTAGTITVAEVGRTFRVTCTFPGRRHS